MSEHIVTAFTDELEHLSANLLRMGGLAEAMINDSSRAVVTFDLELTILILAGKIKKLFLER